MRMLLVALLACAVTFGQSSDELRRKYGQPISESFIVRPGIIATATYGQSGRITELVISPLNRILIKSRTTTLSRDSVHAVLDELVPRSERGKFLIAGLEDITCLPANDCAGTSENYEKVTIYYNAGAKGRICYAVVHWNGNAQH